MSNPPDISRRDILRGKLFGNPRGDSAGQSHAGGVRTCAGNAGIDAKGSIVMRYPRSTNDVGVVNHQTHSPTASRGSRATLPILRPPGAIDEATFLAECTRCDACITACPHDAIIHAPTRFREAVGTPMIDPDRQPCRMCEDFPCVEACEPQVLCRLLPPTMGTARIIEQTCLAHQRTTCTVCSEHCPVDGAIEVIDGKPRVVEEACTGCGVCRYVCPAPENAVLLMPMFSRPVRPAQEGAMRNE